MIGLSRTRRVPPAHYALVGPLWVELEDALHRAGARGVGASWQIRSLHRRLSPQQVARLHYLRVQRNRLSHRPARPLSNAAEWERSCREAIRDLHVLARLSGGVRRPAIFDLHSLWDPKSRGPSSRPSGHSPALPPARSHVLPPFRRRIEPDDSWPTWAKGLAWGLGAWVVLTHEALLSLAMLALLGWLAWTIFGRR